jgi:hypothetical protein
MPELQDIDNSDVEPLSDSDNDESPPSLPALAEPAAQNPRPPRPKITSFFTVETAEEKAVRLERDHREFVERAEENRFRETNAIRLKAARKRAAGRERVELFSCPQTRGENSEWVDPGAKTSESVLRPYFLH